MAKIRILVGRLFQLISLPFLFIGGWADKMYILFVSGKPEPKNTGFTKPANLFLEPNGRDYTLYMEDGKGNRVRADKYFKGLKHLLEQNTKAYNLHLQAFEMTGMEQYRINAHHTQQDIKKIQKQINDNCNLFCIFAEGYSLN